MKRGLVAATAAVLLLLTGCSGMQSQENVAVNTAPSETSAPLTAETPTATAATGDAAFLDEVRANLRPDNVIPDATDAQLLEAGERACEVIATTANTNEVSLIDGEPTNGLGYYSDSAVIISAARTTLCS